MDDPSPIHGVPDRQTVTAEGTSLAGNLDGVLVHRPAVHVDHRGALLEMFTGEQFWQEPFAYAYQTSIRPGMLKGWFQHEKKLDRYHLVSGELLVLLYDDRPDSPTRGRHQKVVLGEPSGVRQVLIPQRVWHLSLNVGRDDAILVNLPSTHYDHEHPDRFHVDIDSGQIPVDVRSFFPVSFAGPNQIAATFQ
jgi:dTDP-4-dehydrorhamnose 3,5-epimerase